MSINGSMIELFLTVIAIPFLVWVTHTIFTHDKLIAIQNQRLTTLEEIFELLKEKLNKIN